MLDLIPPLTMRLVNAEDQTFLDALYRDSRPELLALPLGPNLLEQMIVMQQMSQFAGIKHTYPCAQNWMLRRGEYPVGRLILDQSNLDIRLIDIAVMSVWRGQGIAKCTLQALQVYAVDVGKSISLAVQCDNLNARHLYQSIGFLVISSDMLFDQMVWRFTKP